MSNELETVRLGDTVTLHYKITAMNGDEIDSTFSGESVTLAIGSNALADNLEKCLVGLPVGERHVFQLEPWQAFGISDPELIQEVPLDEFPEDMPTHPGSLIEFALPNGDSISGLLKSKTQSIALVDFNHPLSDCPILFEVEVLEILR